MSAKKAKRDDASYHAKEMYWIHPSEELYWAPGIFWKGSKDKIVVKCLITGEKYEVMHSEAQNVHPSCLGKLFQPSPAPN